MDAISKIPADELIRQIRLMASFALENGDRETWLGLEKSARNIEIETAGSEALAEFYHYAHMWKGLHDISFPGKLQNQWQAMVVLVRAESRSMMIMRGMLKPSVIERLKGMLRSNNSLQGRRR